MFDIMQVYSSSDACIGEWKLGKVLGVTATPDNPKAGDTADVTLRVTSTFKPSAFWSISEEDAETYNTFPVPERGNHYFNTVYTGFIHFEISITV